MELTRTVGGWFAPPSIPVLGLGAGLVAGECELGAVLKDAKAAAGLPDPLSYGFAALFETPRWSGASPTGDRVQPPGRLGRGGRPTF